MGFFCFYLYEMLSQFESGIQACEPEQQKIAQWKKKKKIEGTTFNFDKGLREWLLSLCAILLQTWHLERACNPRVYTMLKNKCANERFFNHRRQKQRWQGGRRRKADETEDLCAMRRQNRGEIYSTGVGSILAWRMFEMFLLQHTADAVEPQILLQEKFDAL